MVVTSGETVHVILRRLFDDDVRRHFAGVVENVTETAMRVTGYAFIFDESKGQFIRRNQIRTRLIPLGDAGLVIHVLPETVELENLGYGRGQSGQRVLTDGLGFEMNTNEFGVAG